MEDQKNTKSKESPEQVPEKKTKSRFKSFLDGLDTTIRYMLVALLLMAISFGIFSLNKLRVKSVYNKYLAPYEVTNEKMKARIDGISPGLELTQEDKFKALSVQYRLISERKNHHRDVAADFISAYNASLLVVLFSAIGAGIVVFLIATKGWSNSSDYIKIAFLTLVYLVVFYSLYPGLYGQKVNSENNLAAFIRYDNLQVEIFNYINTTSTLGVNQQLNVSIDAMISYVNLRIIELNKMYLSTGPTGIPQKLNQNLDNMNGSAPSSLGPLQTIEKEADSGIPSAEDEIE